MSCDKVVKEEKKGAYCGKEKVKSLCNGRGLRLPFEDKNKNIVTDSECDETSNQIFPTRRANCE